MSPNSHGLPIAARPTMTASHPVSSNIRRASSTDLDVAVADDRDRHDIFDAPDDAPVRVSREALGSVARVDRDGRRPGVLRPPREINPGRLAWGPSPTGS